MLRTLLLLSLLLTTTPALAAPQHVRLSFCGGEGATTMCVTWNDSAQGGSTVEYGPGAALGESVEAVSFAATGSLGTIYEAELVGLEPNTEYAYRVGGSPWSETWTFRTTPEDACAPLRFVVLGDGRSQDELGADPKWHSILAEALEEDPHLVLNTGDLVKDGDALGQWQNFLETTDPLQAVVPMLPTIGNHDDDKVVGEGALYNMIFQLPRNVETDTEDFYFVTAGDAIFVSLTSQNYTEDGMALQATWLDQVLTDNPRRWKFVFLHHPPYTSYGDVFGFEIGHPPNEVKQNAKLVPVFDEHHVDVVFSGHNHWYERFSPMKGGGGADEGIPVGSAAEGTMYVISGGAGAFTFDLSIIGVDPMEFICGTAAGSEVCDGRHHYVAVEIEGNTATFGVTATTAQNFSDDAANIAVLDGWTITKTDPLDCTSNPPPDPDPGPETQPQPEPEPEPGPEPPPEPDEDAGGSVTSGDAGDTGDPGDAVDDGTSDGTSPDGTGTGGSGGSGIGINTGGGSTGGSTGSTGSGGDRQSGGCTVRDGPATGSAAPVALLLLLALVAVSRRRLLASRA